MRTLLILRGKVKPQNDTVLSWLQLDVYSCKVVSVVCVILAISQVYLNILVTKVSSHFNTIPYLFNKRLFHLSPIAMSTDLAEEENRENSPHVIKSPLKPLEQSRTVLAQSQKDNQVSVLRHKYIYGLLECNIIASLTAQLPGTTSGS